MEIPLSYFTLQYELIQQSRAVLLTYCKTVAPADLVREQAAFGRGGSMRNLLVHIANTYEFWIGKHALQSEVDFTTYESQKNVASITTLFERVDGMMLRFIDRLENVSPEMFEYEINGVKGSAAPFTLFTHVITHEFHHKGQILSISRQMGYTPVDTDVMR